MDDKKYIETILSLKKKLVKGVSVDKTKHILYKLQKIPISINILEATGIGIDIRDLARREKDTEIGTTAKLLTMEWKNFVRGKRLENEHINGNPSESGGFASPSSVIHNNNNYEIKESPTSSQHGQEQDSGSSSGGKKKHKHKKHKKNKSHALSDNDGSDNDDQDARSGKKRSRAENEDHGSQSVSVTSTSSSISSSNFIPKKPKTELKQRPAQQDNLFGAMLGMADTIPAVKPTVRKPASSSQQSPSKLSSAGSSSSAAANSSRSGIDLEILNSLNSDISQRPMNYGLSNHRGLNTAAPSKESYEIGRKLKHRTALYAGSARGGVKEVLPLLNLCVRVLEAHLDQIEYVGDVPYHIIKPVLQLFTIDQLKRFDHNNPKLVEDCDELWKEFCLKKFPLIRDKRDNDTWKKYFFQKEAEQERKLKMISARISQNEKVKTSQDRKAQTIDVRTPREIKKRAEYAANPFFANRQRSSAQSLGTGSGYGGGSGGGGGGGSSRMPSVSAAPSGPSKTPLMRKLLKMRSGR